MLLPSGAFESADILTRDDIHNSCAFGRVRWLRLAYDDTAVVYNLYAIQNTTASILAAI